MSVFYRPAMELLDDALKKTVEFKSVEQMKEYLVTESAKQLNGVSQFEVNDIVIDSKTFTDTRCGWLDTSYVCVKRFGKQQYDVPQCIGFCCTQILK